MKDIWPIIFDQEGGSGPSHVWKDTDNLKGDKSMTVYEVFVINKTEDIVVYTSIIIAENKELALISLCKDFSDIHKIPKEDRKIIFKEKGCYSKKEVK